MVNHLEVSREPYVPFADIAPGAIDLKDRESLLSHLPNRKMVAEKHLARHLRPVQGAEQSGESANVFRLPGKAPPSRNAIWPSLSLMRGGAFSPEALRPLTGVATCKAPLEARERGGRHFCVDDAFSRN